MSLRTNVLLFASGVGLVVGATVGLTRGESDAAMVGIPAVEYVRFVVEDDDGDDADTHYLWVSGREFAAVTRYGIILSVVAVDGREVTALQTVLVRRAVLDARR